MYLLYTLMLSPWDVELRAGTALEKANGVSAPAQIRQVICMVICDLRKLHVQCY